MEAIVDAVTDRRSVVLVGERGTGKSRLAKEALRGSPPTAGRRSKPPPRPSMPVSTTSGCSRVAFRRSRSAWRAADRVAARVERGSVGGRPPEQPARPARRTAAVSRVAPDRRHRGGRARRTWARRATQAQDHGALRADPGGCTGRARDARGRARLGGRGGRRGVRRDTDRGLRARRPLSPGLAAPGNVLRLLRVLRPGRPAPAEPSCRPRMCWQR